MQNGVPFAALHALPQPPQFDRLVVVSVSHPFSRLASQLARPALHTTPHVPPTHAALPLGYAGHAFGHDPQCDGSLRVSISQPFFGSPSQSANPGAHCPIAQPPLKQTGAALGSTQVLPQPPQLFLSVASDASQPLLGFPSQSPVPEAQGVGLHWPARQTSEAPHAFAHEPQYFAFVASVTSHPFAATPSQSP
jgi:hypothetical protein